jgi:raffinose/stachyose/melibiose transport system substrate-binding protein
MKKLLCGIVILTMISTVFTGCGGTGQGSTQTSAPVADQASERAEAQATAVSEVTEAPTEAAAQEVVHIPILYHNESNDSNYVLWSETFNKFNEAYAGKYVLDIEWLEGGNGVYREKLKVLASSNDLPAWMRELHTEPDLVNLLISNDMLVDLKPYMDADSEWKGLFTEKDFKMNERDGKLFVEPPYVLQYFGIFYNKEIFEKAGVADYPLNWDLDMFWDACEKIKAAGYAPIANYVNNVGWGYTLFQTSILGATPEGQEFMWTYMPTDFNSDLFKNSLRTVLKTYEYSTSDVLSIGYPEAAGYFYSEKAAMFFNGASMINSFFDTSFCAEGFAEKIGYATYPEMGMVNRTGGYGSEAVASRFDKEVEEGAVALLKFIASPENIQRQALTIGGANPKVPLTEEQIASLNSPMKAYMEAITRMKYSVPNYQSTWSSAIQHTVLDTYQSEFASGKMSVDEFAELMEEYATDEDE